MTEPYPGRPKVQGHCPACGRESLFLGNEGHVTCAILACPNPCAADGLLTTDPDGPITPADIQQMTRYATESRPAAECLTGERAKAEEAAFQRGIQEGREQAARDIEARANAREAFYGRHITEDAREVIGWLREAARIAVHGTRLVPRADWQPDTRTYQDGRNDAAQALLACTICGTVHPCRDIGDGEWTYAAPDGHAYHPAAVEAGTAEELAAIARGDQPEADR